MRMYFGRLRLFVSELVQQKLNIETLRWGSLPKQSTEFTLPLREVGVVKVDKRLGPEGFEKVAR